MALVLIKHKREFLPFLSRLTLLWVEEYAKASNQQKACELEDGSGIALRSVGELEPDYNGSTSQKLVLLTLSVCSS
jgi:ferric-dicitrate binding protein FerR (iron transport regulator)